MLLQVNSEDTLVTINFSQTVLIDNLITFVYAKMGLYSFSIVLG